jgi:DNA-binding transcriptional MerR regulator
MAAVEPQTEGLRIGQLAELAGVSVKTLRHYEKVGVIERPPRQPNGYRAYPPESVLRVIQVVRLRSLGLPLSRVRVALDTEGDSTVPIQGELTVLIDFLVEERDRLDQRLASLRELAGRLDGTRSLTEASGVEAVDELRVALGPAADRIAEETWRLERAVVGVVRTLGGLPEGVPPKLLERVRADPDTFATLLELDGALAELRDVDPDDPRVALLADRLMRAAGGVRDVLGEAVPKPSARARAALETVFGSRLTPAQQRVLHLAFGVRDGAP